MVKIKREVKKNLPQLIEWAWDNGIKNERYKCSDSIPYEYVWINGSSDIEFDDDMCISKNDLFTVEVEEEITEDTVMPTKLIEIDVDGVRFEWNNKSINEIKNYQTKTIHAVIYGEFKLVWEKYKGLVE